MCKPAKPWRMTAALVILSLLSTPALALRCGSDIVAVGDDTMQLLRACGQPTMKEHFNDKVTQRVYDQLRGEHILQQVDSPYEVWTYNFGPRRFIQRIRIKNGKIQSIESRGYGY